MERAQHSKLNAKAALFILLLLPLVPLCYGNQQSANHLILFDAPPDGMSPYKSAPFDVRTNFSGVVHFVESRDFRIVVNITAPSLREAYDVDAQLVADGYGGMVLEVKEAPPINPVNIDIKWLVYALIGAAFLVAAFTGVHAVQWYRSECPKMDFLDHKSFATTSSQRGTVYRSRNSIQMMPLPHGNDHGMRTEDADGIIKNIRGDDELRKVQEMPEEEEAEALEMEQMRKLKNKQDSDMSLDTEDSDPQERNLIRSRYHSQSKTIHKEMLKKGKKPAPYRRTQNGRYEGIPTNDNDETDEVMDDEKRPNYSQTFDEKTMSNGSLTMFGKASEKAVTPSSDSLRGIQLDPQHLVLADVHKANPHAQSEFVSISTRDKPARVGNIYVAPPELKSGAVLSTFGPGSSLKTSAPSAARQNQALLENRTSPITPVKPEKLQTQIAGPANDIPWSSDTMGDIPEDPREDDLSAISGSIKSSSMYGSSEIFDAQEAGNTYYNVDSDIEIPPLDSDDCIFSDGGLPSPRALFMQGEKRKTNDDIKMIPGALKSPGANTGRLIKPRPNSSIILGNNKGKSHQIGKPLEVKAKGQSNLKAEKKNNDSLLTPPPCYEEISANPSVFEFPPPPKFLQADQSANRRPHRTDIRDQATKQGYGDYVQIAHGRKRDQRTEATASGANGPDDMRDGTVSGRGRTGAGGKRLGNMYMNISILSTLCVLSLATGVLSQLTRGQETRVDITVFAPRPLLTNTTRIIFNQDRDTEATGLEGKGVVVYDAKLPLRKPSYVFEMSDFCAVEDCPQGCDEFRGTCMCWKGYRLEGKKECVDVNECMEGRARCDSYAGCYNRKGSYDCICGEDFYGDGKSCRDCKQKCPENHYEVRPCSLDKKKICQACTSSCRPGYYLARTCSSYQNGVCRVCRPECGKDEFETRQCTNIHDRECQNVSRLVPPATSTNVMMEDRDQVKTFINKLEKLPPHFVGYSRYKLHRGTGFFVEITVRFIDAAQKFLPMNLTQPFDFEAWAPASLSSYNVKRYCPNPVPDYYVLSYKKLTERTYKLRKNGSIKACETHQRFGIFLDTGSGGSVGNSAGSWLKKSNGNSFRCAQPGSLTDRLNIEDDFFHARTRWVDKSRRCQRNSQACEQCTRNCGSSMISGSNNCSVITAIKDNEKSPRLVTCYNCCVRRNCATACKDYHKRKCQPERCLKGNLLEFEITPSWDSSQAGKFFCHILPQKKQRILEIYYSVQHPSLDKPIFSANFSLNGDSEWEKKGQMEKSDKILTVSVSSGLDVIPNFLEGKTKSLSTLFQVGNRISEGSEFGSSKVQTNKVFVRPASANAVPSMPDDQQDCTFRELDKMLMASRMENPFLHNPDLEGHADKMPPFTVTHTKNKAQVTVKLMKDMSLLKRIFPAASVVQDSFLGNLEHNGTHWVIYISAKMSLCPGFVRVKVQDPNYPLRHIFDGDLVVNCPTKFSLSLGLMTSDDSRMYKDILVTFHEEFKERHFRIYRTASLSDEKLRRKDDSQEDLAPVEELLPYAARHIQQDPGPSQIHNIPDYPVGLPILLGIGGGVILLVVLAILGLCFQPGVPETPFVQWYHPLFAIIYITIQFIYAIVVSGTVFFILLVMITRCKVMENNSKENIKCNILVDQLLEEVIPKLITRIYSNIASHVTFVTRHGREGALSTAANHVEMLQLQRHLEREVSRQDKLVDIYQEACIKDVRLLVEDMRKMHKTLLERTSDVFERYSLDLLLEQQKVYVRQKLSRDLENFRKNYAKVALSLFRRINQDASASYQNILHNNTWLDGARSVRDALNIFRRNERWDPLSFMEFTGMNVDKSRLEVDLSFSLPSMPHLDEMVLPMKNEAPVKRDMRREPTSDSMRSIQVHNNWFFPLDESDLSSVTAIKPPSSHEGVSKSRPNSYMFYVFLAFLLLSDVFLLGHRMCKAWTVARLILFGFPEYFRERKEEEEGNDDVFESRESRGKLAPVNGCRQSPMLQSFKNFLTQTISTTFLPKIVGAVAACVVLICVLRLSNDLLTIQGLQRAGLYHNASQTVILHSTLTNGRLEAHASYINSVNYPAFQALTSAHLHSHRAVLGFYRQQMHGLQNLTAQMHCLHLKAIGIEHDCTSKQVLDDQQQAWDKLLHVTHTCAFQPVEAKLFDRISQANAYTTERQVESVLESLRYIIYCTSQLIIIFLSIIVIKELVFAVIWILIQRSGIIRLRIIVEQDQDGSVSH